MKKKRILVIDDEESLCHMLKLNLEKTGAYVIDTALSAIEGYAKVRSGRYDAIFLDVLMPHVEGGEALPQIKKMTDTPVVVMSAYLLADKMDAIRKAGAFDILEKPFTFEKALETIHKVLAAREKERITNNPSN